MQTVWIVKYAALATGLMFSIPLLAQSVTVFSGGNILTMDPSFTIAEALAVSGNRIVAVGSDADVLEVAGENARVIELGGKTVMPGFVDAHTHPIMGGATSVFDNVGIERFDTVESAITYMKSVSRGAQTSEWALFVNLDLATQSFAEPALTRYHLDEVASEVPVVVWHAGGHKMTVNSRMLELMGVADNAPDPEGARFGRSEDGRPDGNLSGAALLWGALSIIEPYQNYDTVSGTKALGKDWAAKGVTTVGVAGVARFADLITLDLLARDKEFPIRTRSYLRWDMLDIWEEAGVAPGMVMRGLVSSDGRFPPTDQTRPIPGSSENRT